MPTCFRILFLATMTVLLSAAAIQNIAILPVSRLNQPWWKVRFEQKQLELRREHVDLIWLGDSITQNWESDGPQPWRMFAPIWHRFYGDRHAVDLGFKGDSTCHLLWRLRHGELDNIAPRAVVILIGANNFGHVHTDARQTYAGIEIILDEVHQRLPTSQILLLGVLPSIRSAWVSANTSRLNQMLKASVPARRSYLTFIDLSNIFVHDGHVDSTQFLDPRLNPPDPPLHPTAQAQRQIAEAIEPTIAHMLGDHRHEDMDFPLPPSNNDVP